MKKSVCLLLLFFAASVLCGRTVYVTRHGQVGDRNFFNASIRESMLTPLGRKQANLLAGYLVKEKKFNGTIYVSPFYRTIETGLVVAGKLNKKVILEPGLQEIALKGKGRFMKGKVIAEKFPDKIIYGKTFNDSWRLSNESAEMRHERVAVALKRILAESSGDLLLVSHGGTCGSIIRAFNSMRKPGVTPLKGISWNCALFTFTLDSSGKVVSASYTTEYMDDDIVTSNFRVPKVPKPDDKRYEVRKKKRTTRK